MVHVVYSVVANQPRWELVVELDDTICYCFHVKKRKILNFIRIQEPSRVSQISECGGAGTGCGWCIPYLKGYFDTAAKGRADDIAPEEYARQRGDYLQAGHGVAPPGSIAPPSPKS